MTLPNFTIREANIKVPLKFNDGKTIPNEVHGEALEKITDAFGGYSMQKVQGGWLNDAGKFMSDTLLSVDIAMADIRENDEMLLAMALSIKAACRQEALYVRLASGEVRFV